MARVITALGLCLFLSTATLAESHDELGRLFFSTNERNLLDEARVRGETGIEEKATELEIEEPVIPVVVEAPPPRPKVPIRLDGYVLRNDGHSTYWINGEDTVMDEMATLGKVSSRDVEIEDVTD